MLALVNNWVLPVLGGVFLAAIMLGYKDWQEYERINKLNELFYGKDYQEDKK